MRPRPPRPEGFPATPGSEETAPTLPYKLLNARAFVFVRYNQILKMLDRRADEFDQKLKRKPCPPHCFKCCKSAGLLPLSGVEADYLATGFGKLSHQAQSEVMERALAAFCLLPGHSGVLDEKRLKGMKARLKEKGLAGCPLLSMGRCLVYRFRPVVCRVWGYPIRLKSEVICCPGVEVDFSGSIEPVYFPRLKSEIAGLDRKLGWRGASPMLFSIIKIGAFFTPQALPEGFEPVRLQGQWVLRHPDEPGGMALSRKPA